MDKEVKKRKSRFKRPSLRKKGKTDPPAAPPPANPAPVIPPVIPPADPPSTDLPRIDPPLPPAVPPAAPTETATVAPGQVKPRNPYAPEAIAEWKKDAKEREEDVERKFETDFQWFLSRCRRSVPPPADLEQAFLAVVETYKDIEDAKTGKPLFGPKAWKVLRNTLRHIRKGCLSDIPGVSYYYEIGIDSFGIPILHCIRGTSALEGFHQHIRQLIRGYALSPRLASAILAVFVHRWNHNIDVGIRGLSDEYRYFYRDWVVEDLRKGLPFSDFVPISAFADTGEKPGIVRDDDASAAPTSDLQGPPEVDLLQKEALELEELIAGDEEGDVQPASGEQAPPRLPASALWMCQHLGKRRPFRSVEGKDEESYFATEFSNYQCFMVGRDVGNYGGINFSLFAEAWTKIALSDAPQGLYPKTAAHLREYWKRYQKKMNAEATLGAHTVARDNLRITLRDRERHEFIFGGEETPAPLANPPPARSTSVTTQAQLELNSIVVPLFSGAVGAVNGPSNDSSFPALDNNAGDLFRDYTLLHGGRPACPHLECKVDPKDYAPGFPLQLSGKLRTSDWPKPCACCDGLL